MSRDRKQIFLIFILLASGFGYASTPNSECIEWFKRGKVKPEVPGCEIGCAILPVDMGTFICSSQCKRLCKAAPEESLRNLL